jgi:hypothetical protein
MKRSSKYLFDHQVDLSKPKKVVNDTIFHKQYEGLRDGVEFGDLPKDLQPRDIIEIHRVEEHWSENNSWDDHTIVEVLRPRLETDEEHKERLEESQKFMEDLRERRYESYLKLKEEFEEPPNSII